MEDFGDFSEYGDQDALDSIDDYNRFEEREVFNDQEGRVMKINFANPSEISTGLYNRDNGDNATEDAVKAISLVTA